MGAHVLVVDDDPAERRHIEQILLSQGHSVEAVGGGEAALKRLEKSDAQPISAMILDLVMPDLDGMAVLERLAAAFVQLPVIVQAAPGSSRCRRRRAPAGAFDFTVKPASPGAHEGIACERAEAFSTRSGKSSASDNRPVGRALVLAISSRARRRCSASAQLTERAARSSLPVLIEGERGVGKELLAHALHGSSVRRGAALRDGALWRLRRGQGRSGALRR